MNLQKIMKLKSSLRPLKAALQAGSRRLPDIGELWKLNLLGIVYVGLFVLRSLILHHYDWEEHALRWLAFLKSTLSYTIFCNCLLLLLSLNKWVWRFSWMFLCITAAFANYFTSQFRAPINVDSMIVLFQATPNEIETFTSPSLIHNVIIGVIYGILGICIIDSRKIRQSVRKYKEEYRAKHKLGVMAVLLLALPLPLSYVPYNYLIATRDYLGYVHHARAMLSERRDISIAAGEFVPRSSSPLIVVLAIGESARADHFSLNGYPRHTNAFLDRIPNIVNFPYTRSCGAMTHVSVPCLLTRATEDNQWPIFGETSVISVFKKLGFDTAWFGGQGSFALDSPITTISGEAARRKYLMPDSNGGGHGSDAYLIPYLKEYTKGSNNAFIVMHLEGSHFSYGNYLPQFKIYTPVCHYGGGESSYEDTIISVTHSENDLLHRFIGNAFRDIDICLRSGALVNTYDNTILFTDWVLSRFISLLQDSNALFVYVSDHGESLGEHGQVGHGHPELRSNRHVPMVWWASEEYIAHNPDKWAHLKASSHYRVNQDYIFHSLLDCANVQSHLINHSLSLCN